MQKKISKKRRRLNWIAKNRFTMVIHLQETDIVAVHQFKTSGTQYK